jgi:hypothetical protein
VSRQKLIWMAVLCSLLAMVTVLIGTLGSLRAFRMTTVSAAPSGSFEVDAGGMWVVASETRGMVNGKSCLGPEVLRDQVILHDSMGNVIALEEPIRGLRYRQSDRAGVVIGTFQVTAWGSWVVEVHGVAVPALIAVGPDPVGPVATWTLSAGGLAIGFLGVACGFGWVAWRR